MVKRTRITLLGMIALIGHSGSVCVKAAQDQIDFVHTVVPILKEHCVQCHGGHRHEGDFSINTRESLIAGDAVIPGSAASSHLVELVTSNDKTVRMPKGKPPLSESDVKAIRKWIDANAPWEAGFTFAAKDYEPPLRPRRPEIPPAVEGRTNPVDCILDDYLSQHNKLRPAPLDDAAFARRAYLDTIGLLPTPDQLHAFVSDANRTKRAKLIDILLADSEGYAEHWLSFWNDLLRNDYVGTGYVDGGRKQISSWLFRALKSNMPFDQFVRELIAPSPEAEGFILGIKWRGNVNASQRPELQFAQNVSQVFLGMNMKCASCHDSFVDRWKLSETYGLAAICSEQPMELYRCDKPIGKVAEAGWMFPELGQIDPKAPRNERLKQLAALLTNEQNGRLTRTIVNRLWHRLMGRGIVHPVDAMQTEPWSADLLDFLAVDLADHRYDLKHSLRKIMNSQAYQSQSAVLHEQPNASRFVFSGPIAKRMTAEQFIDVAWQITGAAPTTPHEEVAQFLSHDEASAHKTYRSALVASDLLMRSLGRPSREQVVSERPSALTALQALDLANSELLAQTLRRGGANILRQFPHGDAHTIAIYLWEATLSRQPTKDELTTVTEFLHSPPTEQSIEDLLWTVTMLPEFQLVR